MAPENRSPSWRRRRKLTCPEVGMALQRYLDDEIDQLRAQRISRHLEACRRCGMKAATYSAIKRSLRGQRTSVPAETIARVRTFAGRVASGDEAVWDGRADGSFWA